MKKVLLTRLFLCSLAYHLGVEANAEVVTATDFEAPEHPAGPLTMSSRPLQGNNYGGRLGFTIATSDRIQPFGADNQFVILNGSKTARNGNDVGKGESFLGWFKEISLLSTYSFDLYEPSGQDGVVRFGLGDLDLNEQRGYVSWGLGNGVIKTGLNTEQVSGPPPRLEEDRPYKIYVFYNGSGAAQAIEGLEVPSLAPGQCALYIQDKLTGELYDGGRYRHTGSLAAPSTFVFRAFSGDKGQAYVDNLSFGDQLQVDIPEPAVMALFFGIACLGFALYRKAKNRA
ncbi:hypothetical protein [Coraliomargarita parva]|uniref:hypothetical protein n=1 Tax=Coraliomargarita parva TaxID=3014050 RepID=UPI0022B5CE32|nr:hypothetical protein [Coraliomargarita parva]